MVLDSENEEHFTENTEGRGAHGEDKSSFFYFFTDLWNHSFIKFKVLKKDWPADESYV